MDMRNIINTRKDKNITIQDKKRIYKVTTDPSNTPGALSNLQHINYPSSPVTYLCPRDLTQTSSHRARPRTSSTRTPLLLRIDCALMPNANSAVPNLLVELSTITKLPPKVTTTTTSVLAKLRILHTKTKTRHLHRMTKLSRLPQEKNKS